MNKFLILAVSLAFISLPSVYAETFDVEITHQSKPGCDECYTPEALRIAVGDEVRWTNTDSANHNVISGNPIDGLDGMFDSQLILPGKTWTYQFPAVEGQYEYFCLLHPWAQGLVVVGGETITVPQDPVITEDGTVVEQEPIVIANDIDFEPKVKVISDEILNRLYPDAVIQTISNVGLDVDDSVSFIVPYISDGQLITSGVTQEVNTLSFAFKVPPVGGEFIMKLDPRMIDGVDAVWITDTHNQGELLEFTITPDGDFNVINVELPHKPIKGISMSGSHVIPEFGTIVMMVLAVAIVSVIAVTSKQQLNFK